MEILEIVIKKNIAVLERRKGSNVLDMYLAKKIPSVIKQNFANLWQL